MNISLPAELLAFVEREVQSGEYGTASEVVREGLRLLARRRDLHEETCATLRREIALGLDDVRKGRISAGSAMDIALEQERAERQQT